jgi:hypothetical protein
MILIHLFINFFQEKMILIHSFINFFQEKMILIQFTHSQIFFQNKKNKKKT